MSTWVEKRRRIKLRNIILNTVCIALALTGATWTVNYFWKYFNYEITNDAFIDQYISPVNVRVSGYIKEVRFKEHQYVRKGDTLLVLDNSEYLIRVKEAEAALLDAKGSQKVLHSGIGASKANVAIQEANIKEAQARLWQAEQDYNRYEKLYKEESVAKQQFDQVKANYDAAQAHYNALLEQHRASMLQSDETQSQQTGIEANIMRCEAGLDMAKLNLSYTIVTAPFDGYTGRRTLETGQYVTAGQTITNLVRNQDKWVTANYRETQNREHIHRATGENIGRCRQRTHFRGACDGYFRSHRVEILARAHRQLGWQLRQGATAHSSENRLC